MSDTEGVAHFLSPSIDHQNKKQLLYYATVVQINIINYLTI